MKILKHGDVMLFECPMCGCRFVEAVSKTDLKNCGVYDAKRDETGTRETCPDCGSDVVGFRSKVGET